jgi:DNA-binding transcriptional LysR family regulator
MTLSKLRDIIGDPILIRSGAKLVPTERAQAMLPYVRSVLEGIDKIVVLPDIFDPKTATKPFRIASADCMEPVFLPPLIQRLREQSPAARVIVRGVDASFDYAGALERDELDAVICNWPGAPSHLKTARLMTEDIVCLMGPKHPLAGSRKLNMDAYLAASHIAPVARSRADPGPIDMQLAELGLRREIQTMVADFNLIPHILMESDLIFTASARFAGYFESFMPLKISEAPRELGKLKFFLLWHERVQSDARNIWLRGQITGVARTLMAK